MCVHLLRGTFLLLLLLPLPFFCLSVGIALFTSLFKANYFVHKDVTM